MNFVPESLASTQVFSFKLASKNNTYAVNKNDELNRINGYFGKQTDLATEFTKKMFKEIYKMKTGEIKIRVG